MPVDGAGSDAERLLAILKEDCIDVTNIQVDTMRRYLALGRRITHPNIQNVVASWECQCQRDTLVDSISTLRGVMSASDIDEDIAYVLRTLMMQQPVSYTHLTLPTKRIV